MLMITPESLRFLSSRTKPPKAKLKRTLTRDYRRQLVDRTAAILRTGEPTPFAFEGLLRHGLCARLCLRGWGWRDADAVAADVVSTALAQIGAKRPTWKEAQPEWTQDGIIIIERTRCVRCGWQLPEFHRKFCEKRCAQAYHEDLYRRFRAEEIEALSDAY